MAKAKAKAKSRYSVHPGVLMTQKWIASLKEKTGRSLDEWLALIAKKGPKDEVARRDWLKKEHASGPIGRGGWPSAPSGRGSKPTTPSCT
jgi:hypothetical protein